jgi:hypothetical protein
VTFADAHSEEYSALLRKVSVVREVTGRTSKRKPLRKVIMTGTTTVILYAPTVNTTNAEVVIRIKISE